MAHAAIGGCRKTARDDNSEQKRDDEMTWTQTRIINIKDRPDIAPNCELGRPSGKVFAQQ